MDTKGGKWWGGDGCGGVMNWEIGIDIYTIIRIKWITNKNLLFKKINKIKCKKNHTLNLGHFKAISIGFILLIHSLFKKT